MIPELKNLNFKDLIILDDSIDLVKYNFDSYLLLGQHIVKGYCTRCEIKGCNICLTDSSYTLKNISHGATAEDVLEATRQTDIDTSDWHNEGIIFLMESPSKDYDIYDDVHFKGHSKRPTKLWYWIHGVQTKYSYPEEFKGGTYGSLFNSIIFTFKLKNAYLTNLVKCGLNDGQDNYKGIKEYNPETIKTCYDNFLVREIEIIKPMVIFCFGSNVYNFLYQQYFDIPFPWTVIPLPHPARGQNGFSHYLFQHSYYSMILEGLYESGIYTLDQAKKKYGEFLTLSKRQNG